MIKRHSVEHTDRIRVTGELILKCAPKAVLELGAGDYSFAAVYRNTAEEWTTVDLHPPCDVVCDFDRAVVEIPVRAEAYDLVICTQVLEHILWPHALLHGAHKVLKPGGSIIVSTPNAVSLSYRIAWALGQIPARAASGNLPAEFGSPTYVLDSGGTIGGHVVEFSKSRLDRLLRYAGFDPIEFRGSGIITTRQLLPHWSVPVCLASNIIALACKQISSEAL